jgi:hypothetical protein
VILMAVPEFRIEKHNLRNNDCSINSNAYQYLIRFVDIDRPTGDATLHIARVGDYQCLVDLYPQLLNEGLKPSDILAQVGEFYPNGRGLDEKSAKYMHEGVGSQVLDIITRDSLERDAEIMFIFTNKSSMKSFLRNKRGFTPVGRLGLNHYLLLR